MENILDTKGVATVDLVNGSITLNKVLVSEWASKLLPAEGKESTENAGKQMAYQAGTIDTAESVSHDHMLWEMVVDLKERVESLEERIVAYNAKRRSKSKKEG
jgi:hypothetical protein